MEFKVGDEVELLGIPCGLDSYPIYRTIIGNQGTVTKIGDEGETYLGHRAIRVRYMAPDGSNGAETMWFSVSDVAPWERHQPMRPEMELEEIEMAQEVFDVLQNR